MILPFTLGQKVRFKPHHPGDVWDVHPYWVQAYTVTCLWGNPLRPIVFYTVTTQGSPCHPEARVTPYVRADQLQAWPDDQAL